MASPIVPQLDRPSRFPKLHGLDLALFRRATQNPAPQIDRVLYPLSRAANHSKLWIGVAALLAARGGRANRRAAIRGMLSVGATSALTNALIKPVAARRRPAAFHSEWLTRCRATTGLDLVPVRSFGIGGGIRSWREHGGAVLGGSPRSGCDSSGVVAGAHARALPRRCPRGFLTGAAVAYATRPLVAPASR